MRVSSPSKISQLRKAVSLLRMWHACVLIEMRIGVLETSAFWRSQVIALWQIQWFVGSGIEPGCDKTEASSSGFTFVRDPEMT